MQYGVMTLVDQILCYPWIIFQRPRQDLHDQQVWLPGNNNYVDILC